MKTLDTQRIAEEAIRQLKFKITFSETNLRWLAGEPDSEEKKRLVAFNEDAIASAEREILALRAWSNH